MNSNKKLPQTAKANGVLQARKLPVAPPVYRPQPTPKVLQTKLKNQPEPAARINANIKQPVAPPVYRPQPTPKVLQKKAAVAVNDQSRVSPQSARNPHPRAQAPLPPKASPVLQCKRISVPTHIRTNPLAVSPGAYSSPRYKVIQRTQVSVNGNPPKEISDMTWVELAWVFNSYVGTDQDAVKKEAEGVVKSRFDAWSNEVQVLWSKLLQNTQPATDIDRDLKVIRGRLNTDINPLLGVQSIRDEVIRAKKDLWAIINTVIAMIVTFGKQNTSGQQQYFSKAKVEGLTNPTNYLLVTSDTQLLLGTRAKLFNAIAKVLDSDSSIIMANKMLGFVTETTKRERYLDQMEMSLSSWDKFNPLDLKHHLETMVKGNDKAAWKGGAAELFVAHTEVESNVVDWKTKLIRIGKKKTKHTQLQHDESPTQEVDVSFYDTSGVKNYIEVKADPAALIKSNQDQTTPKQITAYTSLRDSRVGKQNKKGQVKVPRKIKYVCPSTIGWMNLYKKGVMANIASRNQELKLGSLTLDQTGLLLLIAKIDRVKNDIGQKGINWEVWEPQQGWRKPEDFLVYYNSTYTN